MAISIGKLAPTAVIVAAVGYCCWPYLQDSGHAAATAEEVKTSEIATSILSPKVAESTGRDPFGMKPLKPLDENPEEAEKTGSPANQEASDSTAAHTAGTANKENPENVAGKSDAPAESKDQTLATTPEVDPTEDLKGLALNATFVRGSRRVAMINSQVYAEGDALPLAESQVLPFKISRIDRHVVLLERDGQTVELKYVVPPKPAEEDASNPLAEKAAASPRPKSDPGSRFMRPKGPVTTPTATRVRR